MMLRHIRSVPAGLVLFLAASCAMSAAPSDSASASAQPAGAPASAAATSDYRLGSGDKLRITVYGEDTLTGEYALSASGGVAFPLIGNVEAAGMTLGELQDSIRAKLAAGYIKDPRVSIEVLNYRPYYILGEVNKPGEYPYTNGLTVQQAVATAGGFTYRANTKRIAIKRALATNEQRVELRGQEPVKVEPGDTIRILERFF